MSLYGDSINLLSGLGRPRSRNFHGSKEVSSLFDKKENGKRKRSKTFHVYTAVESTGSHSEEHRKPLMEKNINTFISKVSEPYKESDNSDQNGDLTGPSAPNFDTVDTIQSQMSLVRISADDNYPENDKHQSQDASSPNMIQTNQHNQHNQPASQEKILMDGCNINFSQNTDLKSITQVTLGKNSPEVAVEYNTPVAVDYNYPEGNSNCNSQIYHETSVPSKDMDDDVILVECQPQTNIISSFYDAIADSEEELEPLCSSSQYLDPLSNLTTIPSDIRTIEPSQYYEENVEDYGTQYSNANFQAEDMSANCNSTHSLDEQAFSQTVQDGDEISREFGEYIINHNSEETDNINIEDKLNRLLLPTTSKLSQDASHRSVTKELLPDDLKSISKITKTLTNLEVTSDKILEDIEPDIQPIVVNTVPPEIPPSKSTERSNVKQSFLKPICKKRTSTLADICSKTNGVKLSTRVGLSKRAKIDSLHSYLTRS